MALQNAVAQLIQKYLSGSLLFGEDLGLRAAMGKIQGVSTLDKFGENLLITTGTDPEDVWEGGGLYPFSDTADIISLSSSDNGDTQDILVIGLDADGNEVEQTITLQGQTRVALTTPLWRVYRMSNEADAGNDLAGTVYCYSGTTNTLGVPSGGSVTKAIIDNGNNQTLMAVYTIPAGKWGFLYRGEVGMNITSTGTSSNEYAKVYYKSRRFGKVFQIKKSISVLSNGNSVFQDERSFPDPIPPLTDIKIEVAEVSDDMGIWSTFDILLMDEELVTG